MNASGVLDTSRFRNDGYLVIHEFMQSWPVGEAANVLKTTSSAGSRGLLQFDAIQSLACRIRNDSCLSTLLQNLSAVQCIGFVKTQEKNWSVAFHRDVDLPCSHGGSDLPSDWLPSRTREGWSSLRPPRTFLQRCVAVRLHLDGAPEGDLRVIPGSHLTDDDALIENQTVVAVPQGGALVMRPLLLHASSKLQAVDSRRVLHFLFAPDDLPPGVHWHHQV